MKERIGTVYFILTCLGIWIIFFLKFIGSCGLFLLKGEHPFLNYLINSNWVLAFVSFIIVFIVSIHSDTVWFFVWESADELRKVSWPNDIIKLTFNTLVFFFLFSVILMLFDFIVSIIL